LRALKRPLLSAIRHAVDRRVANDGAQLLVR
jgi:hypothetical protein